MERGHKVTMHGGGALHGSLIQRYAECDGCLLPGNDPDFVRHSDSLSTQLGD